MLIHIRSLLSAEALSLCQALLVKAPWEGNANSSGTQATMARNNYHVPEGAPELAQLRSVVIDQLQRNALFFSSVLPKRIFPPLFNRYQGEVNSYGSHVDPAIRIFPGTAEQMRADVSCTVFLSEPESYDGGELIIEDTHGHHTIKLAAGDAIVYSASCMHQVLPVMQGERVACVLWAESMVSEEARRKILYDMDISILNLRQTVGDTEAVIRLSASYHNLLRLWSEL
jgi:PKHD-type hydroxylase